ncbi:MAG: aspartate/glutamate racemase family protein [Alphaproteobacteria bacterium]
MSEGERVRRIGVLVGDTDPVVEHDFQRFLPDGFSFHVGRLDMPESPRLAATESLAMMADSAPRVARKVAMAEPEIFLFACTSASFFRGPTTDGDVPRAITAATGLPAVSTSTAVVEALTALGVRRLFMVTPYSAATNRLEADFLGHRGFDVASVLTFDCTMSREVSLIGPSAVRERILGEAAAIRAAGALFVSCTMVRAIEIADLLEDELGVPVVTSNSAALWAVLTRMGAPTAAVRAGRIFRQPPPAQAAE